MRERGRRSRIAWRPQDATAARLMVLAAVIGTGTLGVTPVLAQTPATETAIYRGSEHRYTVALPVGCRHMEGPRTVDAICAMDLDPKKSAVASAARSLLLSVAAESLTGEGDTSITGLLKRYTEASFKAEIPEAVCGESDQARAKIENLSQAVEGEGLVYTADVTCAEIKFLQIGRRHALVRHVIGPDAVFRLVARAPEEVFDKQRSTIDAFFASFQLSAAAKAEQAGK